MCMFTCVWVYVCLCWTCMCVHRHFRPQDDVLSPLWFLSALFIQEESLSWIYCSLIILVWLASLFESCLCFLSTGNFRWAAMPTQYLCRLWGSKVWFSDNLFYPSIQILTFNDTVKKKQNRYIQSYSLGISASDYINNKHMKMVTRHWDLRVHFPGYHVCSSLIWWVDKGTPSAIIFYRAQWLVLITNLTKLRTT